MALLTAILTLALVAFVVLLVSAPLRRASAPGVGDQAWEGEGGAPGAQGEDRALERDELEAAREAKYREIRDSELDYRTGKLSRADYDAIDGQLRGEALAILDRLEAMHDGLEASRRGAGAAG